MPVSLASCGCPRCQGWRLSADVCHFWAFTCLSHHPSLLRLLLLHLLTAGEYSTERLRELAANTRSLPTSKPAAAGGGGPLGGFKLSGSFKPAAPPKDDRFQYNVNAAGVVRPPPPEQPLARPGSRDAALPPPKEPPPPLPAAGEAAQQQAAAAVEDEEEPDIPDEDMIAWAKAKRERLRGAHLAPDYIPTAAAPPGLSRCGCG